MGIGEYINLLWLFVGLMCVYAISTRNGRIAALTAANDTLRQDVAELTDQRVRILVDLGRKQALIDQYLDEAAVLTIELEQLEAYNAWLEECLKHDDVSELLESVEAWLEEETKGV